MKKNCITLKTINNRSTLSSGLLRDHLPLVTSLLITAGSCPLSAGSRSSSASYHASIVWSSLHTASVHTKKRHLTTSQVITLKCEEAFWLTYLLPFLLVCSMDRISIMGHHRDSCPLFTVLLGLLLSLTGLEGNEFNSVQLAEHRTTPQCSWI